MKHSNAKNGQRTDEDDAGGPGTEIGELGEGREGEVLRPSGVYPTSRPPPPPPLPDDEVEEDGEPETIEEIFRAHWARVLAIFRRPGIGPDSQESMTLEVFVTMDRYMQSHGRPADVPGFLATAAVNQMRNRAKMRKRRHVHDHVDVDDCYDLPSAGADPEQLLMAAQSARMLDTILDAMPEDDGRLLRWVEIDEESQEDIAALLEVPSATVRSRLRRARISFKDVAKRVVKRLGGGR